MSRSSESEAEYAAPVVSTALVAGERIRLLWEQADAAGNTNTSNRRPAEVDSDAALERAVREPGSGYGVLETGFLVLVTVSFTLPLPYAVMKTGLAPGVALLLVTSPLMTYTSILVSRSWVIINSRHPEMYRDVVVRQPYAAIGKEAGGRFWEVFTMVITSLSNFGLAVVMLLVMVSSLETIIPGQQEPRLWLIPCAAVILPVVSVGTLRNFRPFGWISGILSLSATIATLGSLVLAIASHPPPITSHLATANTTNVLATVRGSPLVRYGPASFADFWVGAATIFVAYVGAGVFPTIIHDMRQPTKWPRAVVPAYALYTVLSIATGVTGYLAFGAETRPNVLWNVQCLGTTGTHVAAIMASVAVVLSCIFNVSLNILPFLHDMEALAGLHATRTTFKHLAVRAGVWLLLLGFAEALPHFEKYMALISALIFGFTVCVLPPIFYYWLSDDKDLRCGLGCFTVLAEIVVVGVLFACFGTYSAVVQLPEKSPVHQC